MNSSNENQMSSLTEVISSLKKEGHDLDFTVSNPGVLSAVNTDKRELFTEGIELIQTFKFEGKSKPSDNARLHLLKIRDGRTGTLTDIFGAENNDLIDEFINEIKK